MKKEELEKIKAVFQSFPEIKLVYLFGSRARRDEGPLSDYDFAVFFAGEEKKEMFEKKIVLLNKLCQILKTDKVDIAILNLTESPELKYNIIKEGLLIFEEEPFKLLVEPRILGEYFDFHSLLLRHGLTRS